MANLPNLIATDVAALQEDELQFVTRQLEKTRQEKESLSMENGTFKVINEELKKQLNEKNKLLEEKDKELVKLRGKLESAEKRLTDIDNFDLVCLIYFTL